MRALLSVWDKTGLVDFAKGLRAQNIELVASGGTAKALEEAGIEHLDVDDVTGFPEMMDGRLKTLHPKIHGGILARRGIDTEVANQYQIHNIDLVVVNLYPFQQVISHANCTFNHAIENIDIGGPTMVRAAA